MTMSENSKTCRSGTLTAVIRRPGNIAGHRRLISLNVFGRHSEEAFSGLRIEDDKHFLRMRIDRIGAPSIC